MSIVHRYQIGLNSSTDGTSNGSLSGYLQESGAAETVLDSVIGASTYDSPLTVSFTTSNLQSLDIVSDQNVTLKFGGTNEVQTLSDSGTVSGGTFTLTYDAQVTSAIAYNATAATVQAALIALSNIGADDMSCTGGPLPTTDVLCEFKATLGKANVSAMTVDNTSITGGGTIVNTTSTPGVAPDLTKALFANRPYVWTRSDSYYAIPFATSHTTIYVTTTSAARVQGRILTD